MVIYSTNLIDHIERLHIECMRKVKSIKYLIDRYKLKRVTKPDKIKQIWTDATRYRKLKSEWHSRNIDVNICEQLIEKYTDELAKLECIVEKLYDKYHPHNIMQKYANRAIDQNLYGFVTVGARSIGKSTAVSTTTSQTMYSSILFQEYIDVTQRKERKGTIPKWCLPNGIPSSKRKYNELFRRD